VKILYAGLTAIALFVASPAFAAEGDFQRCDGYGAPSAKADGMTTSTWLWGLATQSADIRKNDAADFGAAALAACDRALVDPLLLPAFQLRQAHLLQAKELNQIAVAAPERAIETLTVSDSIAAEVTGRNFQDSIGIGNHAVRAFALIDLGRKTEALKEIAAIEAARPYAHSITALANVAQLKLDSGLGAHLALLKRQAPLFPNGLIFYFHYALTSNHLAEAAEIGSGLTFELPRTRGNWTVEGEARLQYELIAIRAEIAGAFAYALVATGKPDAAAAILAAAQRDLADAMSPPPPPVEGRKLSKSVVADFDSRTTQGKEGLATLDIWIALIKLRKDAAGMTPDQLFAAVRALPKGRVLVIADLVMQLKTSGADDEAARNAFVARLLATTDEQRLSDVRRDLTALRAALPRPETASMQPRLKRAGDGYFLSDNGFSRKRMDEDGKWTIRFTHNLASKATVEEMALLSAALESRREGNDGLLILSSRTLVRTTRMVGYGYGYGGGTEIPSGHEAQFNVLFVKGGALPQAYRDCGWRVLNAAKVIEDLSARYPITEKAEQKAR